MRAAWRPPPPASRGIRATRLLLGGFALLAALTTPAYAAGAQSTGVAEAAYVATALDPPADGTRAVGTRAARGEVRVSEISPAVSLSEAPVTITGTLTNVGPGVLARPTVMVRSSTRALDSPAAVTAWSAGTGAADGGVLGQVRLSGNIPAGQSASFTITIRNLGTGRARTWGVVPVAVQAPGSTVHTYLGYRRIKEYEPAKVALAVPLTLPGDPALWSDGAARTSAWQAATGDDSAISRIIGASSLTRASWVIDPLLLTDATVPPSPTTPGGTATTPPTSTPSDTPSDTPTGTGSPSPSPSGSPTSPSGGAGPLTTGSDAGHLSYAASAREASLRTSLAGTIRILAAAHTPALLPTADPDLTGATATPATRADMSAALAKARSLSPAVAGTAGLAWPAVTWDNATAAGVAAVYGSATAIVPGAGFAPTHPASSALRSANGRTLLTTTPELDTLLTHTSTPHSGAVLAQELVARTAVFVGELPGTARTMLGVAPRGLDPDPDTLATVLDTLSNIPWVQPVSLPSLASAPARPSTSEPAPRAASPAPRIPAPLLTAATAQRRDDAVALVASAGEVRADGPAWSARWGQAGQVLLSSAWRRNRAGFASMLTALESAGGTVGRAVHPEARTVNFLADSGRLQVVVVNTLDVAVSGLRIRFDPGSPILRVTDGQSAPLTIDAGSRATVTLKADALAAGTVPVTATLVAPDGMVLGSSTPLVLRVTPTGDWIYYALGGAAALLVLAGVWRGRRRRAAAASRAAATDDTDETDDTGGANETGGADDATSHDAPGTAPEGVIMEPNGS